ncbi:glycosyltransferase [Frigidibacter sp. MR17.14]|uniref:glycosyltransferase n=1 Tax=Frigidibacter sp. MR17.14 TaxID=3126509 RepID=UPI003012D551
MTAPWLTVIMPVFNGAATLGRTLASLPVDAPGIEILVIDQGSGDASRAIAAAHAEGRNLRIIDAPQNVSWMQNTNLGLREAQSDLVTILHQDDVWLPGRAEALRAQLDRHPEAGCWLHASAYIDPDDRRIGRFAPPFGGKDALIAPERALARLIVQNTVALPSVVFRRDLALRGGGLDETLWYTADWDLWLRLAAAAPMAWSPETRTGFRLHRGSLTVTGSRDLAEFGRQLAIPPARHLDALPAATGRRLRPVIEASNAVNLLLAGRFHGAAGTATAATCAQVMALGPRGIWCLLRDSRIVARVRPRLRLLRGRKTA